MESPAFKERDAASYDEYAETYGRCIVPLAGPLADHLCDRAGLRRADSVLDVGCGTGVATRAAAGRVGEVGSVLGVDLSRGMLAEARRTGGAARYEVMDAEALDLAEGSFDAVISLCAVIHFPDIGRAIGEMHRVLRPGGRLAIAFGHGRPVSVAGVVSRVRARVRVPRRRLVAPDALRDAVVERFPRPADDLTTWALSDPLHRVRAELRAHGFRDVRRSWWGHEVRFDSAEEFWDAQVAIVTEARKRLQAAPANVVEEVRAAFVAGADGAELVYPYQAVFLDATKGPH